MCLVLLMHKATYPLKLQPFEKKSVHKTVIFRGIGAWWCSICTQNPPPWSKACHGCHRRGWKEIWAIPLIPVSPMSISTKSMNYRQQQNEGQKLWWWQFCLCKLCGGYQCAAGIQIKLPVTKAANRHECTLCIMPYNANSLLAYITYFCICLTLIYLGLLN